MKTYLAAIAKKHTRECLTPIVEIKAKSIYEVLDLMLLRYPDLRAGVERGTYFVDIDE